MCWKKFNGIKIAMIIGISILILYGIQIIIGYCVFAGQFKYSSQFPSKISLNINGIIYGLFIIQTWIIGYIVTLWRDFQAKRWLLIIYIVWLFWFVLIAIIQISIQSHLFSADLKIWQ